MLNWLTFSFLESGTNFCVDIKKDIYNYEQEYMLENFQKIECAFFQRQRKISLKIELAISEYSI